MPLDYKSPGVYVEEVDAGPKPIESAGASMPAFIGITASEPDNPLLYKSGQPVLVTSWANYVKNFGEWSYGIWLPDAVFGHFNNGGGPCYVISLKAFGLPRVTIPSTKKGKSSFDVVSTRASGLKITITNDGGSAPASSPQKRDSETTSPASSHSDSFAMKIVREDGVDIFNRSGLSVEMDSPSFIGNRPLSDEFAIENITGHFPKAGEYTIVRSDIPKLTAAEVIGDEEDRTGLTGLDSIDIVRLIACPDIMAGYSGTEDHDRIKQIQTALIANCERADRRDRFAILDTPPKLNPQQAKAWREFVNFDTSYAAMYYPWIEIADLSGVSTSGQKAMPPSGHMSGVMNRVDRERGVHKAPANEIVQGAIKTEIHLGRNDQDVLNPIGVNCIRSFPNRGLRVYGARTLSSDPAWRYINVRRLFIVISKSIEEGLQWVVFEPNDQTLWAKVRRDVNSYLRNVWRTGALFGATPSQAFYVKCDEELNPADTRDLGYLIIEIGVAPVKPAEFVVVRLSQWAGPNAEAE